MVFTKRLREGVRRGEITCSVRFWMRPHVRVGARYPMGEGAIEIDSIETIGFPDITPELARESGFLGVLGQAIWETEDLVGPRDQTICIIRLGSREMPSSC